MKRVIALFFFLLCTKPVVADFATDLIGLSMPPQLANKIGNNFEFNVPATGQAKLKFGDTTKLQCSYDSGPKNIEVYSGTTDGADDHFLYVTGGGGTAADVNGGRGGILELAGNEVSVQTSRGRAQLFSGNVPEGKIGLNITHTDGSVVIQSQASTKLSYAPATGNTTLYGNINLAPDSGSKSIIAGAGVVIDAGSGKSILPKGAAIPATCTVGELFIDTNSNDCVDTGGGDGALCVCKTTNTWALINNF